MGRILSLIIGTLTLAVSCAHMGLLLASELETGTLMVKVEGLTNDEGLVRFGLYGDEPSYDKRKGAVRSANLEPRDQQITWRIDGLPFGDYAIMLHHDENANGKMDKNFIGLPQEGYGFSNDAQPGFGAPHFSQARFEFRQGHKTITIHLQP